MALQSPNDAWDYDGNNAPILADINYSTTYDNTDIVVFMGTTCIIEGNHSFNSITLQEGARLVHRSNTNSMSSFLNLTIGDLVVQGSQELVKALETGSTGMLNVAATCAGAGLIVGVVTLAGLGLNAWLGWWWADPVAARRAQVDVLIADAQASPDPVIIAGDFNSEDVGEARDLAADNPEVAAALEDGGHEIVRVGRRRLLGEVIRSISPPDMVRPSRFSLIV